MSGPESQMQQEEWKGEHVLSQQDGRIEALTQVKSFENPVDRSQWQNERLRQSQEVCVCVGRWGSTLTV